MKKLLTLILLTGALLACNNSNAPEKKEISIEPGAGQHAHSLTGDGVVLNNGANGKLTAVPIVMFKVY